MRLRATLASFLVVTLLALSSAASACQIKCGLPDTNSACHATSMQPHMPPMPGMQHDPDASSNTTQIATVRFQAAACAHHACAQQPVFTNEQKPAAVPLSRTFPAVFSFSPHFAAEPPAESPSGRGPPLLPPLTPVSLHTTLRI